MPPGKCSLCGESLSDDYLGERLAATEQRGEDVDVMDGAIFTVLGRGALSQAANAPSVRASCLRHFYLAELEDERPQLRWPDVDALIPDDVTQALREFTRLLEERAAGKPGGVEAERLRALERREWLRAERLRQRAAQSKRSRAAEAMKRMNASDSASLLTQEAGVDEARVLAAFADADSLQGLGPLGADPDPLVQALVASASAAKRALPFEPPAASAAP